MNNIITYIDDYGEKSFDDFPFNEVDSLVLCQLSYLNYGGFVNGFGSACSLVKIKDIYNKPNTDDLYKDYWYKSENKELFSKAAESKRFGDMRLCYYVDIYNEEYDAQFSAITYILGDKSVYLAFRGTDATIIGWKEDFKLAYKEAVRAQELSVDYMKNVAENMSGNFRTGGHSKGGNLAVYAAMNCPSSIQTRIIDIFDHDGPGFRPEILKESRYGAIKNKIHKYVPKASIVGGIFADEIAYEIVECWSIGALQHNSYVWKSEKGRFIRLEDNSELKKVHDKAMNDWLYSLSDDEISTLVDAIFEVVTAASAKDLFDLIENPKSTVIAAFNKYKELDQKTKDMIVSLLKRFKNIVGETAYDEFVLKTQELKEEMKAWQEDASLFMSKMKIKKK